MNAITNAITMGIARGVAVAVVAFGGAWILDKIWGRK